VVAEQFHGLTVGNPLQILQQAHPQQQNRFEGYPAIVGTVTNFESLTYAS
jgi:hypothetical protein